MDCIQSTARAQALLLFSSLFSLLLILNTASTTENSSTASVVLTVGEDTLLQVCSRKLFSSRVSRARIG